MPTPAAPWRGWPLVTRGAGLLADVAMSRLERDLPLPDTGSLRGDLTAASATCRAPGSGGTRRPPRSREAKAATVASEAAATNTTTRPWWNGAEMSAGKNSRPVSTRWLAAGSADSAWACASRCCTGLTPSTVANRDDTGAGSRSGGRRRAGRRTAPGRGSSSSASWLLARRSSVRRTRRSTAPCRSSGRWSACPKPRRGAGPGRCP